MERKPMAKKYDTEQNTDLYKSNTQQGIIMNY